MFCDLIDDVCDRFTRATWCPVCDRNIDRDAEAQQGFIGAGQWLMRQRETCNVRRMCMHDTVDFRARAVDARVHTDNFACSGIERSRNQLPIKGNYWYEFG